MPQKGASGCCADENNKNKSDTIAFKLVIIFL